MPALPRLNFTIWLQFFSVLLPGFLVSVEVVALVAPNSISTLKDLNLNPVSTAFWLALATCVSYVAGLASRSSGFALAGLGRRRVRRLAQLSHRTPEEVLLQVQRNFGTRVVEGCLRSTDLLAHEPAVSEPEAYSLRPGYYKYCKLWLRHYSPEASVDKHELEINVRFALVIPVVLALPVLVARTDFLTGPRIGGEPLDWATFVISVALSTGLAWLLLVKGLKAQGYEGLDSLNNFVAMWLVKGTAPPQAAAEIAPRLQDDRVHHPAGTNPDVGVGPRQVGAVTGAATKA